MKTLTLGFKSREKKPRLTGLTAMIDPGLGVAAFGDFIDTHHAFIDAVKFGGGSGLLSPVIDKKLSILKERGVPFWFGGTLFERAYMERRLPAYLAWVRQKGAAYFELSERSVPLDHCEKESMIGILSAEFVVLSELCSTPDPLRFIDRIHLETEAGARFILIDGGAKEFEGDVGFHWLLTEPLSFHNLLFKATTPRGQARLVQIVGPDVNLANITAEQVITVEGLRRGLSHTTLFDVAPFSKRVKTASLPRHAQR